MTKEQFDISVVIITVLIIAFLVFLIIIGEKFNINKLTGLKEWLKYAVRLAENNFGSGEGDAKLAYVYKLFVEKYPIISKFMSIDTFNGLVDDTLLWLDRFSDTDTKTKPSDEIEENK